MQISIWSVVIAIVAAYWFVPVSIGILLVWLAWSQRGLLRIALFVVAAVLVIPPALLEATLLLDEYQNRTRTSRELRDYDNLRTTLKEPRLGNGLMLPAGTVVRWDRQKPDTVFSAQLAGPARVNGLLLSPDLQRRLAEQSWEATLLEHAAISGWPCAAGPIQLNDQGGLQRCTLARDSEQIAGVVPAGTSFLSSPGVAEIELRLPGRGMRLRESGVTLPAGAVVELYLNGRPDTAEIGYHKIVVHGVTLTSLISWDYSDFDATAQSNMPARTARVISISGDPVREGQERVSVSLP